MTLYELCFILLLFGSVAIFVLSVLLRNKAASRKILGTLASVWAVYCVVLTVTDVLSAQRIFKVGEE